MRKGLNVGKNPKDRDEALYLLSQRRGRALCMAGWLGAGPASWDPAAERARLALEGCGAHVMLRDYLARAQYSIRRYRTCRKYTLCPACAMARAVRAIRAYWPRVREIMTEQPEAKLALLTLTVRDGPDVLERTEHLISSFGRLLARRRDALKKARAHSEMRATLGGLAAVEVKRGRSSGEWHPHIHAVVVLDRWLNVYRLAEEWLSITGDSRVIDARALHGFLNGNIEECKWDLLEVLRYALKFSDMLYGDNWEAAEALRGKRLLRSWGALWGVKEKPDAGDIEDPGGVYRDFLYRFEAGDPGYVLVGAEAPFDGDFLTAADFGPPEPLTGPSPEDPSCPYDEWEESAQPVEPLLAGRPSAIPGFAR